MTGGVPERRIGRSVGAVAGGFLTTAALSLGTDAVLHAVRVFPPWGRPMDDGLFVVATIYRVAFTILGGYLAARLAPSRPMRHVWILGILGTAAALAGVVATWNAGPELAPRWYPLALAVTALPCVLAGGWFWGRHGDGRARRIGAGGVGGREPAGP